MVCYGAMREFLPKDHSGNKVQVVVDEGASVADAVEALGAPVRLVHAVLVGDEPADTSRVLREGEEITLMPHFTGG